MKLIKNSYEKETSQRDFLTKLYNRSFCTKKINEFIEKNKIFSVFIVDLNKFKFINDVYGHDIGDLILVEVGKRLNSIKIKGALFARFGGDEFAVLYDSVDKDKINELGKAINDSLKPLFVINESEFSIGASIGVARFPSDAKSASFLLKLADTAMYISKKTGDAKNFIISDKSIQELEKHKKISKLLKHIDIEKDLFLQYQPVFNFKSKEVIGLEALVRWKNEKEGIIMPLDFLSTAKELDIVKDITRFTFIQALNQIKTWNETYKRDLIVSLNVANTCIYNKIFFKNFQQMLDVFKVNPEWLAIEFTERSLLVSPSYMKKLLKDVNKLGVKIYLDDFGTGHSSLTNLQAFTLSGIKIDNSLTQNIDKDENKLNLVKSMIYLAKQLKLTTTAEGVENETQYKLLEDLACDDFQGFYKEKPLSARILKTNTSKNLTLVQKHPQRNCL